MSRRGLGSAPREDDPEEIDIVAFQTSLDDSVNAVRLLVDSWTPKNLGPQWTSQAPSTSFAAGARLRPPRLGLGASPGAVHAKSTADAKLRSQLLYSKKRVREEDNAQASGSKTVVLSNGKAVAEAVESDESDHESRSNISSRRSAGNGDPFTRTVVLSRRKQKQQVAPLVEEEPLSDLVDTPPTSAEVIPTTSFYGTSKTIKDSLIGPTLLTKNRKKKDKERDKAAVLQQARLFESESDVGSFVDQGMDQSARDSSISGSELETKFRGSGPPRPPFAPLDSPSMSSGPEDGISPSGDTQEVVEEQIKSKGQKKKDRKKEKAKAKRAHVLGS